MTQQLMQPEPLAADAGLAERCRTMGVSLFLVDTAGKVVDPRTAAEASLEQALLEDGLLCRSLVRYAERWADEESPRPVEVDSGCWLIPVPVESRRRRVGYHVAMLLTGALTGSELFCRVCDRVRLDRRAAARRLAGTTAYRPADIDRFADMLNWMAADLRRVSRAAVELDGMSQQLGETYEELSLVYDLSAHMTVTQDPRVFLDEACAELAQVVGLRWIALQLIDDDARLKHLRGEMILAGRPACDRPTLRSIGRQMVRRFGIGEPAILNDVQAVGIDGLSRVAQRMLVVPIAIDGEPLAVLFGADKADGSELCSVDSKLVVSTAQNMAIFLKNAMLYEDVQDMFMGTLHSLVSAIDAKDTYTCGHSERVAWLSRQLAEAAGLDAHTVERVYLSALVHDVGKIGVPESVLCKPGKLTDEEFMMIKAHPEIGGRILKDIRQMRDLLPGVLHHHERYDGRGYPHRLAGEDIPLFGRLICLADSFDAMSSNRTYRSAMQRGQVLEEIYRCAGTQFDPELAEVFVNLDLRPFNRMLAEHQTRRSPLDEAMKNSA